MSSSKVVAWRLTTRKILVCIVTRVLGGAVNPFNEPGHNDAVRHQFVN